jgi:hypothetical protein
LLQLGGVCLSAGVLLWLFRHPVGMHSREYMHLIDGFLAGLGVAFLIAGLGD